MTSLLRASQHHEIMYLIEKEKKMNCPICKTDISNPENQFGDIKHPICQSCFLADHEWVQSDPEILDYLSNGYSFQDAMAFVENDETTELQKFAEDFWKGMA